MSAVSRLVFRLKSSLVILRILRSPAAGVVRAGANSPRCQVRIAGGKANSSSSAVAVRNSLVLSRMATATKSSTGFTDELYF
eukprot:848296-Prymnesium_polylepis.1